MGEEQRTELERPAHPMVGFIAVIPLPNPDEERPAEAEAHDVETPFGTVRVVDVMHRAPGMAAGIVMEKGPTGHTDGELLAPYSEGCTVFYSESSGVRIGGYTFVQMERVLAWQEAPDG